MASQALSRPLIGWPLLPLPDANGQIHYPTMEQSVRQSIQIILRTRPGEQLMRPEFGAGLEDYLHEPNNLTTRSRIRDMITESLKRWEPRIIVNRIDVAEVREQTGKIRVELAYRLKRTGQAQLIGVTMDMEG